MKKTIIILIAICLAAVVGCTDMNPDVKLDAKIDADAYCEIGRKDSKTASLFWDKVEAAYTEHQMYSELEAFEEIILSNSQTAVQEYPVRMAKRGVRKGEVSYYPDQDAQTYLELVKVNQVEADKFLQEVQGHYNEDGLYEDLVIFMEMCGLETE